MFDEHAQPPSPEHSEGAPPVASKPKTDWADIEAAADAAHDQQEIVHEAETAEANADRPAAIGKHLFDNELFGYEPYGDETLTALTEILLSEEAARRERVDPTFDITSWSPRRIQRILERNYVVTEDQELTTERVQQRQSYAEAKAAVMEQNPDISNADPCSKLLEKREAIPPSELSSLLAFVHMQSLAKNEEDKALITERINALDFSTGVPDHMVFLQTQILSTPEHDTGISEDTQEAMKQAFGVPTLRDASDLLDATDQIQEDGGQFVNEHGKVVPFNRDNGIPLGDYTVYPDEHHQDQFSAEAVVGGRTLRVSFDRNIEPQHLDQLISAAMISQVLANRDLQGANKYILGGDGLAAQGVSEIQLDEYQAARADRVYGAFMGFGVELRTGFPNQSDLEEFERRLQATHIDGDAKTGNNTGRGDLSWTELGMLSDGHTLNMQRVEEIGSFINRNPVSLPTYETLLSEFEPNQADQVAQ